MIPSGLLPQTYASLKANDFMSRSPDFEDAREMFRNGATRGMVKAFLRRQGCCEAEVESVVLEANNANTTEIRQNGGLWLVVGVTSASIGTIMLFKEGANGIVDMAQHGLIFMLIGAGLATKGLIQLVSGVRQPEATEFK